MADRDIGRWVAEISTGYRVKGSVYCHIGGYRIIANIGDIGGIVGDRHIGTPRALASGMTPLERRERTRLFMLRVIRFCRTLPPTTQGQEIGRQLILAGMGTADNYRSAQRARSRTEFASRLSLALDEADEAHCWLTAACDLAIGDQAEAEVLKREAAELCAIFGRGCQTAKRARRSMAR